MMVVVPFIVLVFLLGVHGVDRKRLSETPPPAKNFDLTSWVQGEWYIQARYVSCSFSGSGTFTDISVKSVSDGKMVKSTVSWRSLPDFCSTLTSILTSDNFGCGAFIQKDPIGGMASGDQIVVVYNPTKGYDINWGCAKRDNDGRCSDPSVWVKTREMVPGRKVWECIYKDLNRIWGLSLTEMRIVKHKNPCSSIDKQIKSTY